MSGHDRITGRRPAGQIGRPLPASSPTSAPCPPWARDASRLPPILVSPLLTPSHLPCHWLVLFSSLAPLALPGHMGMVTHLFVPGHSPPFLQSEGQKSLLPDRVNLSASFLLIHCPQPLPVNLQISFASAPPWTGAWEHRTPQTLGAELGSSSCYDARSYSLQGFYGFAALG